MTAPGILPSIGLRPVVALLFAGASALAPLDLQAQDVAQDLERLVRPRSGVPCPSPVQYSPLRPDPPGVPTVVGLSLVLQDVSQLSDVEQTLTADVYVMFRWRDPRLADPDRGDGSADCPMPGEGLWVPAIETDNLRSREQFYPDHFLVDARGLVTVVRRLVVRVANPLDFHAFPFDRHRFLFTLWPVVSQNDEVRFVALNRFLRLSESPSIQGWSVGPLTASVAESGRLGRAGTFSRFDATLELRRNALYYVLKLGLPLALIVLMAYTAYFIPPANAAQQIAVGMTSMLTLIAYMLALGSGLPKISYLTTADKLFAGSALLVFLGLLKGISTIVLLKRGDSTMIDRLDGLGRWLYPLGIVLVVAIAFWS